MRSVLDTSGLRLSRAELLVLVAIGNEGGRARAEIARRAGLGRFRARLALWWLARRGHVRRSAQAGGYELTERGSRAGRTAFAVSVLRDSASAGAWDFVSLRWGFLGTDDDRSILGPAFTVEERADDVAGLAELARTGGLGERRLAVRALGALRSPDAVPVLADVLGSETEDDVRAAAARALARIRSADARAALLEASRGGSSFLLAVVAESLGTAGEDAAGARLVELLGFPSSPVRAAAAEALGALAHAAAIPALAECLRDDDRRVRDRARGALVAMGSPVAVAALREDRSRPLALRALDVSAAKATIRHAERRSRHPAVTLLRIRLVASCALWATVAAAIALLAVAGLDASALLFFGACAATAVTLAVLIRMLPVKLVDRVHVRSAPLAREARRTPGWRAAIASVANHRVRIAAFVAPALAVELLTGATGLAAGAAAGLATAAAAYVARDALHLARYERARRVRVWTDAVPGRIPKRRYFTETPSSARRS